MKDICCIGHVTRDTVITPQGTRVIPGGTAVYFSYALSRMDISYGLLTAVAAADAGLLEGLDRTDLRILPSARTVHFENRYGEDTDQRTQRVLAVADPFTVSDLKGLEARIFHLGPLLSGDIPVEAIPMLASHGRVSLDVQGLLRRVEDNRVVTMDWADKTTFLPNVYYLKASEEEMTVLTGVSQPVEGAKILHEWGVQEVVITMGSRGSYIYTGEVGFDVPPFRTSALDATGCGDTYMAGYLLRRLQGAPEEDAGLFAAAMATLKIEGHGPFVGTSEDVVRRIKHGLSS